MRHGDEGQPSESNDSAPSSVEATRRSIEILRSLKEDGSANLTEIADRLGYSKSTVHRHLSTLEDEGYVTNTDDGYQVGLLFLDYGIHAQNEHGLYQIAKPKVDDLANELDEKVWIMAEENGYGTFLYHNAGKQTVETYTRDGYRARLHAFAAGKAVLAFMDREKVEDILDRRGLPAETSRTITDRAELLDELEAIRERGVAFNRSESIRGVHAVAAPIIGSDDEPVGSLTVAGPANRLKGEYLTDELPELILGVANEIEVNLTYG
ncbi:IclR family transcriptional regulator [Halobellus inordinatus]|uniref:IclR family transcriptional regulator n=1 Tax=Halobellus inordinatus TaxID=1126236 RepID=UPI00211571ED|nr:IclR family transcriptional regulator [Halobellus ramosii]